MTNIDLSKEHMNAGGGPYGTLLLNLDKLTDIPPETPIDAAALTAAALQIDGVTAIGGTPVSLETAKSEINFTLGAQPT